MWLLIPALCVAVAGFLALSLWQGRDTLLGAALLCPRCEAELDAVADGPSRTRSYAVLGCGQCGYGVTMVHGRRSLFAYCPACQQLALQTDLEELGVADGQAWLRVHESCHLCGHAEVVELPEAKREPEEHLPDGDGKVLPFRRP